MTEPKRYNLTWFLVGFVLIFLVVLKANADVRYATPDIIIDNHVNADASASSNSESNATSSATSGSSNATITGVKQVPGMGAPSVFSSHPCAYGRSAVLAVRDFGVGGGGQKIDEDCADREWARMMFAFGMEDAARELACASPSGQKLKECENTFITLTDSNDDEKNNHYEEVSGLIYQVAALTSQVEEQSIAQEQYQAYQEDHPAVTPAPKIIYQSALNESQKAKFRELKQ